MDSAGNSIFLKEGLQVSIYSDDVDEKDEVDNLVAEGVVIHVDLADYPCWKHVKWCCHIDENGLGMSQIEKRGNKYQTGTIVPVIC